MFRFLLFLFLPALNSFFWTIPEPGPKKILLVFYKTERGQTSLADQYNSLKQLASENNWTLDSARLGQKITETNLRKYHALLITFPLDQVFDLRQRNELERYLQAGGGLLQISRPPAPESDWPWYTKLQEAGLKARYVKNFQVEDKSQLKNWHTPFDGGLFSQVTLTTENQSFRDDEIFGTLSEEIRYVTNHAAPDYSKATTVKIPE